MKNATAKKETAAPQTTPVTPGVLVVKADQKYRGARAAWYARLVQYNNKPVQDFLASVAQTSPSVRTAKSKLAGQAEPPQGWLRWFTRAGVLTIKQ